MTAAEDTARRRDGHHCRRCGISILNIPSSLHHRLPRGMGGSKSKRGRARMDRPSNLIRLCGTGTTGCHGWIESNRAATYASGWLVHRWDDPAAVPITDRLGRTFLLDDQGGINYYARREARA